MAGSKKRFRIVKNHTRADYINKVKPLQTEYRDKRADAESVLEIWEMQGFFAAIFDEKKGECVKESKVVETE